MKRQNNMSQMKEQNKTPPILQKLNKMKTSNLLDAEFKTMVIRMLSELKRNIDGLMITSKKRKHKSRTRKHRKKPISNEEYITGNQQ